jgi:hypothetical protein
MPHSIAVAQTPTPTPSLIITDNSVNGIAVWTFIGNWGTASDTTAYNGNYEYGRQAGNAYSVQFASLNEGHYNVYTRFPDISNGQIDVPVTLNSSLSSSSYLLNMMDVTSNFNLLTTSPIHLPTTGLLIYVTVPLNTAKVIKLTVGDAFSLEPLNFRPIVLISHDFTGGTIGSISQSVKFSITFSEPVTGFSVDDIEVSGGTLSNFNWISESICQVTANAAAQSNSPLHLRVPENVCKDLTTGDYQFGNAESNSIEISVGELDKAHFHEDMILI